MSKKKLLKESTIRRFGGLAGIKPATTSNFLSEMGEMDVAYERDDEEEMEVEDEEVEMDIEEEPVEDELALEEPAEESGAAEDLVVSLLDKVKEWASEQGVDMDVEEEGEEAEAEMEVDMEMDAEEEGGEEELEMGAEEDITLEEMINTLLSETEEEVIEEETEEEVVEESEETQETQTETVKVLDDESLIQEVSKRVKQRLAKIAKSQRQSK